MMVNWPKHVVRIKNKIKYVVLFDWDQKLFFFCLSVQNLISLFKIPMGTRKNFLEIYRQFGHAPSKIFASRVLVCFVWECWSWKGWKSFPLPYRQDFTYLFRTLERPTLHHLNNCSRILQFLISCNAHLLMLLKPKFFLGHFLMQKFRSDRQYFKQ
jgi:hypothetical protein